MFNNYMWQTYLNANGKNVVEMFERNLTGDFSEEYADNIMNFYKIYCPSKTIVNKVQEELLDLFTALNYGEYLLDTGEYTIDSAMDAFYENFHSKDLLSFQKVFDVFSGSIAFFTTFLAFEIPTLFVPYYFCYNFNILQKIAQEFEITLPPIPVKKDYKSRFYYYGEICKVLLKFREEHHMSPYELCAFLYDFAPKYIGGIDSYIIKDLPEPKSAFFIGGDKDDDFLSDNADTITIWQCNPRAEAGDIAVMYLRSPISAVNSHWRCVSNGFIDPFFYYYMCAYISKPTKLKRVSQNKLEQDKIFKNFPLVKKNMQGINGVELLPSQYNHLMDLSNSNVCRLEYTVTETGVELMCEKDVEDKLIKPLLKKLGYTEKDFEQQVHIEIGNHNGMLIPDFLILPNKKRGQQSAFAIVEAKYNIRNAAEFEEVKIQARSYARQILAKYCIIASKDKLWVSVPDDDYTKDIFVYAWDELNNSDIFSKLFKLIGKKTK